MILKKIIVISIILTCIFSNKIFAQNIDKYERKISFSQFITEIQNSNNSIYSLQNAIITIDSTDSEFIYADSIMIDKELILNDIRINSSIKGLHNTKGVFFNNYFFNKKVTINKLTGIDFIFFNNCVFKNGISLNAEQIDEIIFSACNINNNFSIDTKNKENSIVRIQSCNITINTNEHKYKKGKIPNRFILDFDKNTSVFISNTSVHTDSNLNWVSFASDISELDIINSEFYIDVNFSNIAIKNKLRIHKSEFHNDVSFTNTSFPISSSISLKWEQLKQGLSIMEEQVSFSTIDYFVHWHYAFNRNSVIDSTNSEKYDNLIALHNQFFRIYKERGDLESANSCYIDMKDIHTNKLKYNYKSNPCINTYLYLKLNEFLKYFAKYGTSPIRAITVSFWVILFFSFIYFFMYNEWDRINLNYLINQHKKLILYFSSEQRLEDFYTTNYKNSINEYHTFKKDLSSSSHLIPFFITILGKPLYYFSLLRYKANTRVYRMIEVLKGKWIDLPKSKKTTIGFVTFLFILIYILYLLIIRFFNSLMLSINTFSTLGFGDIPLNGWTRYIAIIEGFLGWFLLSIFSVSLISQILQI